MSDRTPDLSGRSGSRHGSLGRSAVLLLALALLVGCNTRGGKIPYDPAGFGPPTRAAVVTPAYDVPLGPLDVLKVNVFRVPELSGEYQVDAHGNLDLPLLGSVSVRDQNAEQFAQNLEQLYGARYLNNPDISVRVQTTNQYNITVDGGVLAPGLYELKGQTTLLGAVAMARGVSSENGNPKRVAIFRKVEGRTMAAAFDVTAIRHGTMNDPIVYPGDTIVVDTTSPLRATYRELLQTLPLLTLFRGL